MKRIFSLALAFAASLTSVFAGGAGWLIDFEAAKKKAAAEKKDLLVDFTGSDWCGYCIKLSEEVFAHDAFKKGVADSFVLVEIDFPNDKTKLSDETQVQNEKLSKRYGIEGFPTIILMDAEGRPYGRTGYSPGGPEAYLEILNELRQVRQARGEGFASASAAKGVAKAKLLNKVLEKLPPEDVDAFYAETVEEIIANDPKDETGFAAARAYQKAVDDFEKEIEGFFGAEDVKGNDAPRVSGVKMENPRCARFWYTFNNALHQIPFWVDDGHGSAV